VPSVPNMVKDRRELVLGFGDRNSVVKENPPVMKHRKFRPSTS
jgi:hypothetical protein